jgi:uncharacterized membrane protein YfcA
LGNILGLILAFFIATFGALLQGSVGFGLGLIGVPLLVLIDPTYVPGPVLLAAFFLNLLIFFRERHAIHIKGLHWAIIGRIVGAILGAMILLAIPQKSLSAMFGVMVLLAIAISLAGIHLTITPKNIFGAGVASGILGTTSSIGGPPIALIYQKHDGPTIRGTLSGIFIFGTIISLIALTIIGRFGLGEIKATGTLIPGVFLGFLLSNRSTEILDRGFTRPSVLITSAISGIVVILRNLL